MLSYFKMCLNVKKIYKNIKFSYCFTTRKKRSFQGYKGTIQAYLNSLFPFFVWYRSSLTSFSLLRLSKARNQCEKSLQHHFSTPWATFVMLLQPPNTLFRICCYTSGKCCYVFGRCCYVFGPFVTLLGSVVTFLDLLLCFHRSVFMILEGGKNLGIWLLIS